MRIIIDARSANLVERKTGVQHYMFELIQAISRLDLNDIDVRFVLDGAPVISLPNNHNCKYVILDRKLFFYRALDWFLCRVIGVKDHNAWSKTWLSAYLSVTRWDVYFCLGHGVIPKIDRTKLVLSIQDLWHEKDPDTIGTGDCNAIKEYTNTAIESCMHIVVPSRSTKNDLITLKNIPESKISVVYYGGPATVDFTDYDPNMLLCVTCFRKSKNIYGLIKAFNLLTDYLPKVSLTIAGHIIDELGYNMCMDYIKQNSLQGKIKFIGFVTELKKKELFHAAGLLVVPSFYEGFGLQVIEAIRHGCPVAASRVGSLAELLPFDDIDTSIDPYNIENMAEKLKYILNLIAAGKRKEITDIQRKHIKEFTWEKCALETIKIIYNANKHGEDR